MNDVGVASVTIPPAAGETQAGFFGTDDRLFGVYHAPQAAADRDVGVVVCAPYGREYLKTHRALLQLAKRLARSGFHVLRFDYRGCGDSAGEPIDVDLEAWAEDAREAADELKDRAGLLRVSFVGLRLGATLALLAARARRDVEALALWEPVLDGRAHLAAQLALAEAWCAEREIAREPSREDGALGVVGFPFSPRLRASLEAFDRGLTRRPARRVLVLREAASAMDDAFLGELQDLGVVAEARLAPSGRIWLDADDAARALVPAAALGELVAWLEQEAR